MDHTFLHNEQQFLPRLSFEHAPRRQASLIRPERERVDPSHRQYHTRRRAMMDQEEETRQRRSVLRRDLLARDDRTEKAAAVTEQRIQFPDENEQLAKSRLPDIWKMFCYAVTCCCPPPILKFCFGKKDKAAQYAFREKIGLVTVVIVIMAMVGFLTFGFTQTVCPKPPLSFRIDHINEGYVLIHGWAYMLASWNGHPAIPDVTQEPTNPVYPPIGAGGQDASFLFQESQHCTSIFKPVSSSADPTIFFPCQLFDPHQPNDVPASGSYANQTACHKSPRTREYFKRMKNYGVPNAKGSFDKAGRVYYEWDDIVHTAHLAVFNSQVLNLNLLKGLPKDLFQVPPGGMIDHILRDTSAFAGQDLTRIIASHRRLAGQPATSSTSVTSAMSWRDEATCLAELIKVGEVDTESVGCLASNIVLYTSLVVILGVILVKFVLAVIFGWFLSWKLGNFKEGHSYKDRMRRDEELENWAQDINTPAEAIRPRNPQARYSVASNYSKSKRKTNLMPRVSRFTQPEAGATHFNAHFNELQRPGSAIWKHSASSRLFPKDPSLLSLRRPSDASPSSRHSSASSSSGHSTLNSCPFPISRHVVQQPKPDYMPFGFALAHTICLVTCYSEGEEGLRTTLDSIATTDYPNSHKLILVIADGMITGHGNAKSTPDTCVDMMCDFIIPPDEVQPQSYIAIADGTKRHNMAKIYAGFYRYDNRSVDPSQQQRVPMITIAKCGPPEEANERKPGNRGKRDSQVILMSFLQKVMFDERMTELEYEFFNQIWRVTGVTPDKYEICLMVDADTKVYPDALSRLVSCMVNDDEVAGLCGETKIGNKKDSWVSMIQVFEYYISHHQSKAFESIFGNVTCLPGCFCMYRIKAPKGPNGHWVPILANPDIIEHYSENVVDTLHKKNLLLLGEDRYLSTLMLKTFPRRKMLFVPQAVCKTVVPDSFMVLLSQRRRWINSTIHNLFELLLVPDLCGTFCFSMQFVVFMELVGTLALPAAITFTLYLIVLALLGHPAVISLILLALILGLPAVLIVMTSRKVVYVGWMFIYLFSLPIWNFVLPTYAYWHFDDFTWGETRKVEGSGKDEAHGDKEGEFDSSKIVMKKWCEFERERKIRAAEEKRRRRWSEEMNQYYPALPGASPLPAFDWSLSSTNFQDLTTRFAAGELQHDARLGDTKMGRKEWRDSYRSSERPATSLTLDTHLPMPTYRDEGEQDGDWHVSVMRSISNASRKKQKKERARRKQKEQQTMEEGEVIPETPSSPRPSISQDSADDNDDGHGVEDEDEDMSEYMEEEKNGSVMASQRSSATIRPGEDESISMLSASMTSCPETTATTRHGDERGDELRSVSLRSSHDEQRMSIDTTESYHPSVGRH